MIRPDELRTGLTTRNFGRTVHTFERLDSTNAFAKSLGAHASHGTLVVAEEQTAGRGRQGRTWNSPPGENLLFSLFLKPDFDQEKAAALPFASALGVLDGVRDTTKIEPEVKWPNDLLLRGKKFCGMLIESAQAPDGGSFVLGIGINVNQRDFPADLEGRATSLALETGKSLDRTALLRSVLESLELRYDELRRRPAAGVVEEWKRHTKMFGQRITLREGNRETEAIALDISPHGALVVDIGGVRKEVLAGDVTLLRE